MYLQAVNTIISQTNLAVTLPLAQSTANHLQSMFGDIVPDHCDFEILSALAIRGELDLSNRHIDSGASIEAVMRHLGGRSKQTFLTVVTRQCSTIIEDQPALKTKIGKLKRCHQIYQKYKTAFIRLSNSLNPSSQQAQFNLMAVFWILYLLIKHRIQTQNTIGQETFLLRTVILLLFKEILNAADRQLIYCVFAQYFQEIDQANEQKQRELMSEMMNRLNQVHKWRHHEDFDDLQKLLSNEGYVLRYLDDISNIYEKLKNSEVDQLSFLELQKTLTPLPPPKNINTVLFDRKIKFDDEDDSSLPSPRSNPKYCKFEQKGPFMNQINRKQNLAWMNKIQKTVSAAEIESVRLIYQPFTPESSILFKIRQSIQCFTPACLDKQKREQSLYRFFVHLVHTITGQHTQTQNAAIFSHENSVNSVLCLSVHLFNHAYHCSENSYHSYCQIFQINLLEGHKPINWLGLNLSLPKNIQRFLYNLQKRILLKQIWQDKIAQSIITQNESQFGYHNYVVLARLKVHVEEQLNTVCSQIHVPNQHMHKITELAKSIVEKKRSLLISNTIDTILVCCVCAIVGETSLQDYQDSHSHNPVYNEESSSASLTDYYHTVFLPSIQEIIEEKDNSSMRTPQKIKRRIRRVNSCKRTPSTHSNLQRQSGRQSENKQGNALVIRTFIFGSLDDF